MKPTTCRHCGTALNTLQRHAGLCGAAGCRLREVQARWARLAQQLGEPAQRAAAPHAGGARTTLLWLRHAETKIVPVPKAARAAHRAHLQRLIEQPVDPSVQPLAPAPPPSNLGNQEWRLCAQCRGRCCTQGGPTHAFTTLPQLLRWQQREAGRTLQDAVDWYMAQIPPRHTWHACVYQGPQGCVLPREERADICNSYACDPLLQVQQQLQEEPQAAFVAVTLKGDRQVRRALISDSGTKRI
jgi:hypothetical protein